MKNTIDAIKYGLETLKVSPKELNSLIESSKGYDGDDYKRWLANEIIKIAEKDDVGYSQLLAKWFNLIQSIIEEYSDDSIKPCYEDLIKKYIEGEVYTIGMSDDNPFGTELKDVEWGNKVDLMFNTDFIDTLPENISNSIKEDKNISFFFKLNPKGVFKKNCDLVLDAKQNGISIKSYDAMILYRMCSIIRALDNMNLRFSIFTDTKFLYDKENTDIIKYLLMYFNYKGFVVDSQSLYEGSFTNEEYAICEFTPRGIDSIVQDGIELPKLYDDNGILKETKKRRYSEGSDMFNILLKKYSADGIENKVPMVDDNMNVVGVCKGNPNAYGYLCKCSGKEIVVSTLPIENSEYIAITDENIDKIIAYYGVVVAMKGSGWSSEVKDIVDGHPDYNNLVGNCLPLFLFDISSKFCDMGILKNKSGKEVHIKNKFDMSSSLVEKLFDTYSIYFSYEAKELVNVCKGFVEYINTIENIKGITFEQLRKEVNDDELNKKYLNSLYRCKEFVSSLYRGM